MMLLMILFNGVLMT